MLGIELPVFPIISACSVEIPMKSKYILFIGHANINKIFSCLGKRSQNMYQPYSRYSNSKGYQHQQHPQQYQPEYQEYVPVPHQAQGPPAPYQQPSNPFMAPLAPTPPFVAQSKKGKKKKRTLTSPATPMSTPPVAVVAPAPTATPDSNPPASNLPGHEWVLIAKGTTTPAPSTSPEVPSVVPEHMKVNAGLYQAQAELYKV